MTPPVRSPIGDAPPAEAEPATGGGPAHREGATRRTGRIAEVRAKRALQRDYELLRTTTLTALRGKLERTGIRMDPSDLEAAYNLAWHALYAKLAGGEVVENPGGFLTQAAYFRAVDEYRARHPERRHDGDPEVVGSVEIDIDAQLDDAQRLRAFSEGLRERLNERERQAAVLCYLQGYSRPEAAKLLDLSPSRMEKVMDRVSKVVAGLVTDLREGSWCASRRSLMTAYALGVLDPDGERRALAVEHLETCPGCRSHVRRLRGMGAIVPPVALPWGALGVDPLHLPGLLLHGGSVAPAASGAATATTGGSGGAAPARPRLPRPRGRGQVAAATGGLAVVAAVAVAAVSLAGGGGSEPPRAATPPGSGAASAPAAPAPASPSSGSSSGSSASSASDAARAARARAARRAAADRRTARARRVARKQAAARQATARRAAAAAAAAAAVTASAAETTVSTPTAPAPSVAATGATPDAPAPTSGAGGASGGGGSRTTETTTRPDPAPAVQTDAEQEFGVEP